MGSSKVDTSYLSQQVNSIINQLHGLFDDIGVSDNDRENRESEVSLPSRTTMCAYDKARMFR